MASVRRKCCCGCAGHLCECCGADSSPKTFTLISSGINTINWACDLCDDSRRTSVVGTYVDDSYCATQYDSGTGSDTTRYCNWLFQRTGYTDLIGKFYDLDDASCASPVCETSILQVGIRLFKDSFEACNIEVYIEAVPATYPANCDELLSPGLGIAIFRYTGPLGDAHPCRDTLTFPNQLLGQHCHGTNSDDTESSDTGTVTITPCCA